MLIEFLDENRETLPDIIKHNINYQVGNSSIQNLKAVGMSNRTGER